MDRLRRSLTLLAQAVARGRGLAHKSQLSRAAQHGTEHENCYQRARSKVLPMCPVAEPRPLDQATSSIRQFDRAVGKPIEQIDSKDVQQWIDGLINADAKTGLHAKTVNRKLGEIRNYWSW